MGLVRKGRKGNRKVKSGCLTCKVRKVKCDEEHPFCRRCTSTGRKCDGYSPSPTSVSADSENHPEAFSIALPSQWKTSQERHTFDHFLNVTGPALGGQIGSPFWERLIPQICYDEPAVRAGILAISASHERFMAERATSQILRSKQLPEFILEHYIKSMRLLSIYMDQKTRHELVLIMCIVFICLEFLQNSTHSALLHIQQGLQLLTSDFGIEAARQSSVISQYIVPMFWRLNYIEFLFGGGPHIPCNIAFSSSGDSPMQTVANNIQQTVRGLREAQPFEDGLKARNCLVQITNRGLELLWLQGHIANDPNITVDTSILQEYQRTLLSCLEQWFAPSTELQVQLVSKLGATGEKIASSLHSHYHMTTVWLSTALSQYESEYDLHKSSFLTITALVAPLIASAQPAVNGQLAHPFTLEWNFIAPLYFTATKCRWPYIRLTALSLMQKVMGPQQSKRTSLMFQVAKRIVETEERAVDEGMMDDNGLPEESRRIAKAHPVYAGTTDDGRNKYVVTFKQPPMAMDSPTAYPQSVQETFFV